MEGITEVVEFVVVGLERIDKIKVLLIDEAVEVDVKDVTDRSVDEVVEITDAEELVAVEIDF